MSGPRVLLIEHERVTPAGLVADWLDRHNADVDVVKIDVGERHDPATAYDLIVSLGSEFSAYDDHLPWLGRELELLREAVREDVPVLGICFGGQLLARAMGSEVFRARDSEIGWYTVETKDPELVAPRPWFQWHFDTFTPPPGAEVIARSKVGPQAYRRGHSLGLQFHPEVNVGIMEKWVEVYLHELEEHNVDPDELMDETRRIANEARSVSESLLEGFFNNVAKLGGRR